MQSILNDRPLVADPKRGLKRPTPTAHDTSTYPDARSGPQPCPAPPPARGAHATKPAPAPQPDPGARPASPRPHPNDAFNGLLDTPWAAPCLRLRVPPGAPKRPLHPSAAAEAGPPAKRARVAPPKGDPLEGVVESEEEKWRDAVESRTRDCADAIDALTALSARAGAHLKVLAICAHIIEALVEVRAHLELSAARGDCVERWQVEWRQRDWGMMLAFRSKADSLQGLIKRAAVDLQSLEADEALFGEHLHAFAYLARVMKTCDTEWAHVRTYTVVSKWLQDVTGGDDAMSAKDVLSRRQ